MSAYEVPKTECKEWSGWAVELREHVLHELRYLVPVEH